jgi:pimeloyl-ACP methyl ester carboxylesterase
MQHGRPCGAAIAAFCNGWADQMAREHVQVIGFSAATPGQVWAIVGDFCGMWHPAIATMVAERDTQGHLTRAFTIKGEDKTYRERLTFRSDTDMTMAYTHVEGIAGAEKYNARLSVVASDKGGSVIRMSANLSAPAPRAKEIASGTEAIFQEAVAALAAAAEAGGASPPPLTPLRPGVQTETLLIDSLPRLAIELTPQKDGPLCLFLHGIGGSRLNWQRQLGVVGHRTRAASLDLRGYGASTLGPQQSTIDDYCDDILRVAGVLGADKLILVGLSYGSWIATSFAMRHPEMLAGLVLSGGCTGMSEAGASERDAFRVSREVPLNAGQVPADFAPAVVNVIAGPHATEAVRAELHASMAAIPAPTYRDALMCFTNPLERFDFSELAMPVLMMTGEFDRLAPPAEIRSVAERIFDAAKIPDVQFEMIAGVGHVCNIEGDDAYSRHLDSFVARIVK